MKILAIGNSFSQDATTYLHQIAEAAGDDLYVENLYIGGCSLERHYNNIKDSIADYHIQINGVATGEMTTIKDALLSDKWDYVTIQQASHYSFMYSTYEPYIYEIANHVREFAPDAELVIHQTWAYEDGCPRIWDMTGNGRSENMFRGLEYAYKKAARKLGNLRIIKCGEAFYNITKESRMVKIHRDSYHALIPHGRYLLACVWYEFFTGKSVIGNTFVPCEPDIPITDKEIEKLQNAAHSVSGLE